MFTEGILSEVKFGRSLHRDGTITPELVNVILQNHITREVLFGASMSEETLEETIKSGFAVLYSKSRKKRWKKGEGSGDLLQVVEMFLNCNRDQLLVRVIPLGAGVCHEKNEKGITKATCFNRLVAKQKITRGCRMIQLDIVVPDGSMQEVIMSLLAKAGLSVTMEKKRTKEGKVGVEWIRRIAFQRPQEIPHYLNRGHFDVAIVGEDWIANWGYKFPALLKLPIGRGGNKPVRIVLAVSEASSFKSVEDLPQGCEVATEYVQLAQKFFFDKGRPDITVVPSYGNTEHKIQFGATAIVDVTESGESLRQNGLRIIDELMESSVMIVANEKSYANADKRRYVDCFIELIKGAYQASQYVMLTANVPKQALEEAVRIIGGLKGPTCSALMTEGWFALQSVIPKQSEQDVIFELLQIGVADIVVNRDTPMIMS